REIAVADQLDSRSGSANVGNEFFVAWTVKHDDDQVFYVTTQALGDVLKIVGDGSVEFDGVLAGRADDDLVHVAIRCVEQATTLGSGKDSDCARRARSAQVSSFQGIDSNVNFRNLNSVGEAASNLLADVEHGSFVALALADDDGAAHGDGVHRLAHGFGGDLV